MSHAHCAARASDGVTKKLACCKASRGWAAAQAACLHADCTRGCTLLARLQVAAGVACRQMGKGVRGYASQAPLFSPPTNAAVGSLCYGWLKQRGMCHPHPALSCCFFCCWCRCWRGCRCCSMRGQLRGYREGGVEGGRAGRQGGGGGGMPPDQNVVEGAIRPSSCLHALSSAPPCQRPLACCTGVAQLPPLLQRGGQPARLPLCQRRRRPVLRVGDAPGVPWSR